MRGVGFTLGQIIRAIWGTTTNPPVVADRTVNVTNVDGAALVTHTAGHVPGDLRNVDGAALTTHTAGQVPSDVRNVDGAALATHGAGYFPGDTRQLDGAALTTHVAGQMPSDARSWRGTALPAEDTAGYPKVTIKNGTGTGELDLNAGKVKTVKSVQYGVCTYASGALTAVSGAFSAVDQSKTLIVPNGESPGTEAVSPDHRNISRLAFNSTTTVIATRKAGTASGGGDITGIVNFAVIELY